MKFAIKSIRKREKAYSDIKKVVRFAFIPVCVNGEYIWLERYYCYRQWTEQGSNRVRYRGTFKTSFYDAWVTIKREKFI